MEVTYNDGRYTVGTYRIDEGLAWAAYDAGGRRVDTGRGVCEPTPAQLAAWDGLAIEVARRWHSRQDRLAAPLFIRFGRLPRGRSRNYATGHAEKGVSAYRARYNLRTGALELAGDGLPGAAIVAAAGGYGGVTLLVTGEVVGIGSDGEPLIANPRVLAHLTYDREAGGFVEREPDGD